MARYFNDLTDGAAGLADTDLFYIERGNAPFKLTLAALKTAVAASVDLSSKVTKAGDVSVGPMAYGSATTALGMQARYYGTTPVGDGVDTTTGSVGAVFLDSFSGSVGAGGTLLFGAAGKPFAYIKGYFTSSTSNGTGTLLFGTRTSVADATLTKVLALGADKKALFYGTVDVTGAASFSSGLDCGSTVAGSATDLSKHVALFGTSYGFGVTANSLNYVAPSASAHRFYVNGAEVQNIAAALNTVYTGMTVDCSASTGYVFQVNQPGTSPAGSVVYISSPGTSPGFIGMYAGTKRRDIVFSTSGIQMGASASTAAPSMDFLLDQSGNLTVTGDIYAAGTAYYGDAKEMFRYSDSWLRLNPAIDFSSGIYLGTWLTRTDGSLQVGSTSTSAFFTSTTVAPQWKGIELGYRNVPLTTTNANYTYVADDAGKGRMHTDATARTYTIPAVFAAGDVLTVVNSPTTANVTLAGSGVNLFLSGGTGAAGNRVLGARAVATVFFITSTSALVSGPGVT